MTDAEISQRLALEIGWAPKDVMVDFGGRIIVRNNPNPHKFMEWRKFDYRDPAVIWPIAEKFNLFPRQTLTVGVWACQLLDGTRVRGNTAAKAVALALIAAKGKA